MKKIPVGILGATGMVGQHYVELLSHHPWFEIAFLAASDRSANKAFSEAVAGRWLREKEIPASIRSMKVEGLDGVQEAARSCKIVFSALANDPAKQFEELYAKEGLAVISNASVHRGTPDVPVLIPEINADHLDILAIQRKKRGWTSGCIVVKPNCSLQSYMIPLAPLHQKYGVRKIGVTTLQAVSGAGYPGPSSYDIMGNVIPYISGEEEKSEKEPCKIWGAISNGEIVATDKVKISAHCNRVPVMDGHLACVSVEFAIKPSLSDVRNLWDSFSSVPQALSLPSAPSRPIVYRDEPERPQPRLDRDAGLGMAVTCGRLRECPLHHLRFVALSHNTLRGAAGGGVLNAELLVSKGYVEK